MLRLNSTLHRAVVPFEPRDEGKVSMYLCGPTVQGAPHVGHGRSAVAFDMIRRYLLWRGFDVTFVRNVTDIEDKIIAAANESGQSVDELAKIMAKRFDEVYRLLGALQPDHEPKATEYIGPIIDLIGVLIDRGLAYPAGGDVYYSVRAYEEYGKLSGRNPDDLRSGFRIEVDEAKHDPLDFALWKGAKPGEPWWDSPWGAGRPGWHIECSAMARGLLGDDFDIHGGGNDLIFPHHENEIAQSEGASGTRFARYWLHNGMVNLGGEKMAKSTGQVVDLKTLIDLHGGRSLRLLFLRAHYRSPIEYSPELLEEAGEALDRLERFLARAEPAEPSTAILDEFRLMMDDDFGTPAALSLVFDQVREGNRMIDDGEDAGEIIGALRVIYEVLGLGDASVPLSGVIDIGDLATRFGLAADGETLIIELIALRDKARTERRFDDADAIRSALDEAGIVLEDGADGTRWLRK
jgi:cysteinyl-tRNA synthetase